MKKGVNVKVKKGITLPNNEGLSLGEWQGRIAKTNNDIAMIKLDSITLDSVDREPLNKLVYNVLW